MSKNQKLSSVIKSTVGVGILSWKSHNTLEKSLISYEKIGFRNFFDEVKIIFQEISDEDKKLAEKYGYDYVGIEKNVGIQEGHKFIYKNMNTDYVLVLENDNPVVEEESIVYDRLLSSLKLLESNTIDIMRLRHRWNFGEGFSLEKYLDFFELKDIHEKYSYIKSNNTVFDSFIKYIKRTFRPDKAKRLAGYSLYCEMYPEKKFPNDIKKLNDEFYSVNSNIMAWTNQSVLLKRDLYGSLIEYADANPSSRDANGFQDLEKPLNSKWWRNKNYRIGVGEGIFSHNRFDDSWRKSHHAYNDVLKNNNA